MTLPSSSEEMWAVRAWLRARTPGKVRAVETLSFEALPRTMPHFFCVSVVSLISRRLPGFGAAACSPRGDASSSWFVPPRAHEVARIRTAQIKYGFIVVLLRLG